MRTLVVMSSGAERSLLQKSLRERGHLVEVVDTEEAALAAHAHTAFEIWFVELRWVANGSTLRQVADEEGLAVVGIVHEPLSAAVETEHQALSTAAAEIKPSARSDGERPPQNFPTDLSGLAIDMLWPPLAPERLALRLGLIEQAAKRHADSVRMRARLSQTDRMTAIGTLAAGVAHELNNPLMYVLSNLRLVREELRRHASAAWLSEVSEPLNDAVHGAKRMRNIVGDLKAFARQDSDNKESVVELASVIESSLSLCKNELRHRTVLEKDIQPTPNVEVQESRLGQVFVNLLINAAQAMPERSISENRVVLRTWTDDEGWAVAEVSDNGVGIERQTLDRIFDTFFTTKEGSAGTGLGLAICRDILSEAGGEITANSELGAGTTFRVRLPPSKRAATLKPDTLAPPPGGASMLQRAQVVVVDDEPLVARSIKRALRHHDVQVCVSGAEAIGVLCERDDVDVVFCDLMMPEVSGMEVFAAVADRRPDVAAKFVFMSGGVFTPLAQKFVDETSRPCLEKPFDLGQIRDLVDERINALA